MDTPVVYDKGKYHDETVMEQKLPEEQASAHTAFYLGWIIENDLYSDLFKSESPDLINDYKARKVTAIEVYEWWDRCLIDDMLSEEGNQFSQYYFDFENGKYIHDYEKLVAKSLPSIFHVSYTWDNQELISSKISERYQAWKNPPNKKFWKFW